VALNDLISTKHLTDNTHTVDSTNAQGMKQTNRTMRGGDITMVHQPSCLIMEMLRGSFQKARKFAAAYINPKIKQ
jgi:hypothetical protein